MKLEMVDYFYEGKNKDNALTLLCGVRREVLKSFY